MNFDGILAVRGYSLDNFPLPLWKLKLAEDEYQEIKDTLRNRTVGKPAGYSPFLGYSREVALYISEYWRREYSGGAHSWREVYESLGIPDNAPDFIANFREIACKGAEKLGLEIYGGEVLDSMLYQGGLPINRVVSEGFGGGWERVVRKLVTNNLDFSDVSDMLGVIAQNLKGLREFCRQLRDAVNLQRYDLMPFDCAGPDDLWYKLLANRFEEERKRIREVKPFSVDWTFDVDSIGKIIKCRYNVSGPQTLNSNFYSQNHVSQDSLGVTIKCNSDTIGVFNYVDNFCRYSIDLNGTYRNDDCISVFLGGREEPILSSTLDLSVPHLLSLRDDGKYGISRKAGPTGAYVLLPQGWSISDGEHAVEKYTFNGAEISVATIGYGAGPIEVESDTEQMVFNSDTPLYKTILSGSGASAGLPTLERLHRISANTRVRLCEDDDDFGVLAAAEYRSKWSHEWSANAPMGEIYVRAVCGRRQLVESVKLINVGPSFSIDYGNVADGEENEVCKIMFCWPEGSIVPLEKDCVYENGAWVVRRSACENPSYARFRLTPRDNPANAFEISVIARYKFFGIYGPSGKEVPDGSCIALADVAAYSFRNYGYLMDVMYSLNGTTQFTRKFKFLGTWGFRDEYGDIEHQGSILQLLLNGEKTIRVALDHSGNDFLKACFPLSLRAYHGDYHGGCFDKRFVIKEFPYRMKQISERNICVYDGADRADFREKLKLTSLEHPEKSSEYISYDENVDAYVLPDSVKDWGDIIVSGYSKGRVRPMLAKYGMEHSEASPEERVKKREDALERLKQSFAVAKMGDELWKRSICWFERINKDQDPTSSILELVAISQNYELLIQFLFQLYVQKDANKIDDVCLREYLRKFSTDLDIQWHWLIPYIEYTLPTVYRFSSDVFLNETYVLWAITQPNVMDLIASIEAQKVDHIMTLVDKFKEWLLFDLCQPSLVDSYNDVPRTSKMGLWSEFEAKRKNPRLVITHQQLDTMFVDFNQELNLKPETLRFFEDHLLPMDGNEPQNEKWLRSRVNVVVKGLKEECDLFGLSGEIRRSIIFCHKSFMEKFVCLLTERM